MKNSFKTNEEYYEQSKKLTKFEISEFDLKFADEDELDMSEFEEVKKNREIKFDFNGYEKSFYHYLDKYLKSYTDGYDEDFIETELKDFKLLKDLLEKLGKKKIKYKDFLITIVEDTKSDSIRYFFIYQNKYLSRLSNSRNTITSIKKIISFLEFKQSELNDNSSENNDLFELIDFEESSVTEKIIILSRLGVLDFLRTKEPFNTSIKSLANAISLFTGDKSGTIQSNINPMFSKNVNDKNNPFKSKNAITKADQKLISIGFKIKNTN